MSNFMAKRQLSGVPSASIAKLKTKVNEWVAKRGLIAVDLLSVEQLKARLHTLDTKFKRYLMDVNDSMDNESEIDREHDAIDQHESRVTHIVVSTKGICSLLLHFLNL